MCTILCTSSSSWVKTTCIIIQLNNKIHVYLDAIQARTQGGVGGVVRHPLETAGIDFYGGFRKNGQGGCKSKKIQE